MGTTILLLDKDAEARVAFSKALQEALPSALLHCATTAREAAHMLTSMTPDLLFVDINDAHECLQEFETVMTCSAARTIPIVMHSRSRNPTLIAWAYSYGAILFFKKPSHFSVLVMGLRKVLEESWRQKASLVTHQHYSFAKAKVA